MTTTCLTAMAQAIEGVRLIVEEEFCVNLRARQDFCSRCVKACQAEALEVSENGVDLDEAVCTACGACVPACPAGVQRLSGFDPEQFVQSLGGAEEVHLHCPSSQDQDEGATIPCHLMLDRRLIAAAFAEGTHHFVIHGLEKCASCHRGDARDHLDRLESGLARWFADDAPELSLAVPGKARSRPRRGTAEPATDRRRFLRLLGLQAGASVAERVAPATDDLADEPLDAAWAFAEAETLRKRPVPYHAVLARRIKRLPWSDNRSLPWHTRTIEEACSACMVCAENCPTGALEGSSDPGTRRISFDPAFCTNCSLCQQICPQDAIRPRRAQSATEAEDQRAVLMHRTTRQCDVCRSGFVPTDPATRLCPVCANEREMDEEWLAMLSD